MLMLMFALLNLASAAKMCPKLCSTCPCLEGAHTDTGIFSSVYESYLGIPYAEKPINELRFKNPKPLTTYPRVLTGEKPKCIQRNVVSLQFQIAGNEDCLYMNIYRPKQRVLTTLPVFVYFPHSNFLYGSAEPRDVAADWLMDYRNTLQMVLVVVQYRVGMMGFFSTADRNAPGNLGLKDQQLALRWIKNNIATFWGSNTDITVYGDATVQYQLLQPSIDFHKIIITGGYMFTYYKGTGYQNSQEAAGYAKRFGLALGYGRFTSEQLVKRLQNETIHSLMEVLGQPHAGFLYPFHAFGPVYETNFQPEIIPEHVPIPDVERFFKFDAVTSWKQMKHDIPILLGFNRFYGEQIVKSVQTFGKYLPRLSTIEGLKFHLNLKTRDQAEKVINRYNLKQLSEFKINDNEYFHYISLFTDRFYRQPLWKTIKLYNERKRSPALYVFNLNQRSNFNNADAKHLFNTFIYTRKSSATVLNMFMDFIVNGTAPADKCVFSTQHPSGALCPYVVFSRNSEDEEEHKEDFDILDDSEAVFWRSIAPVNMTN